MTISDGNTCHNWPFSIAMLNYKRVSIVIWRCYGIFWMDYHQIWWVSIFRIFSKSMTPVLQAHHPLGVPWHTGQSQFSSMMFRLLHFLGDYPGSHVRGPTCSGIWWISIDLSGFCWLVLVLVPKPWGEHHQKSPTFASSSTDANRESQTTSTKNMRVAYTKSISGKHMNKSPTNG